MTSNKEDYLKAIYDAGGCKRYVSNKTLAQKLGVAPASVSEMLVKLQLDGLIEYRAYHGTRLTKQGLDACMDVVRSHELWEVFLIRHLGYSWWEAHEEAHRLEHLGSDRLTDRLDEFLGYPRTCPHGSRIPRREENPVPRCQIPAVPLSDLEPGQTACTAWLLEDKQLLDYLEASGFRPDEVLQVVSKETYEGPVTLTQNGETIRISYKAASGIFVTLKD